MKIIFEVWWNRLRGRLSGSVVKLKSNRYVNTSVVLADFLKDIEPEYDKRWRISPRKLVKLAVEWKNAIDEDFDPVLLVDIKGKIFVAKRTK